MSTNSIQQQIVDYMVDRLGLLAEEITPTARFREDLDLDSLDMVEMVSILEKELNVQVADTAAQTLTSLSEVVAFIEAQRASGEDAA